MEGQNRRVVVSDGIGLPNALTYDSSSGQVCWADAGERTASAAHSGCRLPIINSDISVLRTLLLQLFLLEPVPSLITGLTRHLSCSVTSQYIMSVAQ